MWVLGSQWEFQIFLFLTISCFSYLSGQYAGNGFFMVRWVYLRFLNEVLNWFCMDLEFRVVKHACRYPVAIRTQTSRSWQGKQKKILNSGGLVSFLVQCLCVYLSWKKVKTHFYLCLTFSFAGPLAKAYCEIATQQKQSLMPSKIIPQCISLTEHQFPHFPSPFCTKFHYHYASVWIASLFNLRC